MNQTRKVEIRLTSDSLSRLRSHGECNFYTTDDEGHPVHVVLIY